MINEANEVGNHLSENQSITSAIRHFFPASPGFKLAHESRNKLKLFSHSFNMRKRKLLTSHEKLMFIRKV